jgi:hypothetical protein
LLAERAMCTTCSSQRRLAWSYAKVGRHVPSLMEAIARSARQLESQAGGATLERVGVGLGAAAATNLAWAYATLGHVHPPLMGAIAQVGG